MIYKVKYSKFTNKYLVINIKTGIAQSSWDNRANAVKVVNDLNSSIYWG